MMIAVFCMMFLSWFVWVCIGLCGQGVSGKKEYVFVLLGNHQHSVEVLLWTLFVYAKHSHCIPLLIPKESDHTARMIALFCREGDKGLVFGADMEEVAEGATKRYQTVDLSNYTDQQMVAFALRGISL